MNKSQPYVVKKEEMAKMKKAKREEKNQQWSLDQGIKGKHIEEAEAGRRMDMWLSEMQAKLDGMVKAMNRKNSTTVDSFVQGTYLPFSFPTNNRAPVSPPKFKMSQLETYDST